MTRPTQPLKTSLLPVQAPPVRRPDLIPPHLGVDVINGSPEALLSIRMKLLHGANYNDPAPFESPFAGPPPGGPFCVCMGGSTLCTSNRGGW